MAFAPIVGLADTDPLRHQFQELYGKVPRIFSAPGRINLLGEHTDYNEGFVLPIAIQLRTFVAVARRNDRVVRVRSLSVPSEYQLDLDEAPHTRQKSWFSYVEGTARSLEAQNAISGCDLLIGSDLPQGVGLSSSAALEVAVGFALRSVSDTAAPDRLQIALAGQRAEHDYVGANVGIMDQFVVAFAREGQAILLDCRSLVAQFTSLDLKHAMLAVCDSGVTRKLADSAYNERRAECDASVIALKHVDPRVKALRDVTLEALIAEQARLPQRIFRRAHHVVTENARTLSAASAFAKGDLVTAGQLMSESHDSLRLDYEVSCPELDFLVSAAAHHPGVYGSRMTGAGFGGCTIHLLEAQQFAEFQNDLRERYLARFQRSLNVFRVMPSVGAQEHV